MLSPCLTVSAWFIQYPSLVIAVNSSPKIYSIPKMTKSCVVCPFLMKWLYNLEAGLLYVLSLSFPIFCRCSRPRSIRARFATFCTSCQYTASCKRRAMQEIKGQSLSHTTPWLSPFFFPFFPPFFCAACLDCPFNTFLNSACAWLKWSFSYKPLYPGIYI